MRRSSTNQAGQPKASRPRGCVVWFTGLPSSGKSTLAEALQKRLLRLGRNVFVLDGDIIRTGLCSDLGFSARDRDENIRRLAEVAALFAKAGVICITAFISPYRAARDRARQIIGRDCFFEIHVATKLALCEKRDVKGLYRKARAGAVRDFTGVSAPYEPPRRPALRVDTAGRSVESCVTDLVALLKKHGMMGANRGVRGKSA